MKITLRVLIENGIIDENQKIWVYKWENGVNKSFWRGRANELKDDSILDNEYISIAEIQKNDLQWLIDCKYKKDYVGVYII
jgi:hypothetical protein